MFKKKSSSSLKEMQWFTLSISRILDILRGLTISHIIGYWNGRWDDGTNTRILVAFHWFWLLFSLAGYQTKTHKAIHRKYIALKATKLMLNNKWYPFKAKPYLYSAIHYVTNCAWPDICLRASFATEMTKTASGLGHGLEELHTHA